MTDTKLDRRQFLEATLGVAAAAVALPGCLESGEGAAGEGGLESVSYAASAPIPPHRAINVPGLHAYADSDSVEQGETISFAVSSDLPYEMDIVRLGDTIGDHNSDSQPLLSETEPSPIVQAIHPGSYVHVENALSPATNLGALTVEVWVRVWSFEPMVGLISQTDTVLSAGFGLFLDQGGLVFEIGDGGGPAGARRCTVSNVVEKDIWTHVAGVWDGINLSIFVNGVLRGSAQPLSITVRAGACPLRLGAAGKNGVADHFLNGDLAAPVIWLRALPLFELQARVKNGGISHPSGPGLWASWSFAEENSATVADHSGLHPGLLINRPARMIGGPSFDANIGAFSDPFISPSVRFSKQSYLTAVGGLPATTPMTNLTLECWVNIRTPPRYDQAWPARGWTCLVGQHDYPNRCGYGLFLNDRLGVEFYLGNGAGFQQANALVTAPDTLERGFWYHIAGTYDGSMRKIYINGELVLESSRSGTMTPGAAPLRIGAYGAFGHAGNYAEDELCMVAIYNRTLSAAELRGRFDDRARTAPTTGVLAVYPLNEAGGGFANDNSGQRPAHLCNLGEAKWMGGGPDGPLSGRSLKLHAGDRLETQPGLDSSASIFALSLECWVRPYVLNSFAGILTQHDYPSRCGFGLFLNPNGGVSFYLGDGGTWNGAHTYDSPGALTYGRWHHLVGTYQSSTGASRMYIDGALVASRTLTGTKRAGSAPIRIGAYLSSGQTQNWLTGDLAMAVIHDRALTQAQVTTRFQDRARNVPTSWILACWPMNELSGNTAADSVGFRTAYFASTDISTAPAKRVFSRPCGDRLSDYDPNIDPAHGHGIRFNSDDLYDCRWDVRHHFTVPINEPSGLYEARFKLDVGKIQHLYHVPFIVRPAARAPKKQIVVLAATNTWRAYGSCPFIGSHPFGSITPNPPLDSWHPGEPTDPTKYHPGNNVAADVPKYSFYRPHGKKGNGEPLPVYQVGLRMPLPAASPNALLDPDPNYGHLLRQERHTHIALRRSKREFDLITDRDLSKAPSLLLDYDVLIIPGHSEYWTAEMYHGVEAFLGRGGKVLALTANAIWWRVSYDPDFEMMECRKIDWNLRGGSAPVQRFGESWHSTDGQRGGLMRECSMSGLHLIGVEFLGHFGSVDDPDRFGHFDVINGGDPLFQSPNAVPLQGGHFQTRLVGHEFDITFATMKARMLAHYQSRFPGQGYFEPTGPELTGPAPSSYSNINRLARSDFATDFAFDYFARWIPAQTNQPEAELIEWARPAGGRVVSASSIDSGRAFHEDPVFRAFIENVLASFGV